MIKLNFKGEPMKFLIIALLFMSPAAFAYQDGTYTCKNANKELPDNVYKFETVQIGSIQVPAVEITRYFKKGTEMETVVIKGVASVHASSLNSSFVRIGSAVLEFKDGEFLNCKK